MAELIPQTAESNDAISRISRFMSNTESGVVLTIHEEKMMSRLMYANGLLSEKRYSRVKIEEMIVSKFGVSSWTARADINNTYTLFVTVTEDYKRYTLFHHIESIEAEINKVKNDKSLVHLLPKLLAEKTKAIAALPVKTERPDLPAPVIVLSVVGEMKKPEMDTVTAREEADSIIELEDKDFIDYEEVKNNG